MVEIVTLIGVIAVLMGILTIIVRIREKQNSVKVKP